MKRSLVFLISALLMLSSVVSAFAANNTSSTPDAAPFQMSDAVYISSHRVMVNIDNQVATTRIEQIFVNETDSMAEGTYVFPLPRGAVVSDLVMYVDGEAITARILDAGEARAVYEEIVRTLRDPALLEYVGQDAIQASVFPIQPHDEIKIEIEYSHILPVENGLVHYVYPLRTDQFSNRPVGSLSLSVNVTSNDPISSVYSPSHSIAISREGNFNFRAGYETTNSRELSNFSLYYGLATSTIDANLLTYRESASEPGFFLLLIAPPVTADEVQVQPKDVIIVLDQSGSMFGEKWDQAREAVKYVLDNLNSEDRFNIVAFSTGWRIFANGLESPSEASNAKQWVDTLEAIGGTDIDGGLTQAFQMADDDRQTVVLFLTDGIPTEGETDAAKILENAENNAPENVRIFSFGVGDDLDTFLLEQLNETFNGTGTYVRPNERIDEEVAALYNKISSPVMTDIELNFGDVVMEDMYPAAPLPDLFLGSQLIIAGRYRGDGETALTLTGKVNGETVTYTYENLEFPDNAGGEVTIPRLWATRKIGSLLNSIRLNGENQELVDSIVRLSLRYGIITPYTSFMIDETDIFTQQGRDDFANQAAQNINELDGDVTGSTAVDAADRAGEMEAAEAAPMPAMIPTQTAGFGGGTGGGEASTETGGGGILPPTEPGSTSNFGYTGEVIQVVGDRTFVMRDGSTWIDTTYDADTMTPTEIIFLSDAYFELLTAHPEVGAFLALGDHIIFVIDDQAYEVKP